MTGIQIKIAGEWLELPEDFSISLEQNNPLFNEQGTFSFPFEIPIEPNRHIFKNVADPFGDLPLSAIDKTEAEVWFGGVMLYRGIIEADEEVEFDGVMPVTFLSGNSDFMSRIEGMNARDVPLDREIKLGYVVESANGSYKINDLNSFFRIGLPKDVMMAYTECNVSDPYPVKPYCNVRACCSNGDGGYMRLEADRPYSGCCFYVMYFLDCLFKYMNISAETNNNKTLEDINRLAFFSAYAKTKEGDESKTFTYSEVAGSIGEFSLIFDIKSRYDITGTVSHPVSMNEKDFGYTVRDVFATNENFPDVDVQDIIDDLSNAFGMKLFYEERENSVKIIFYKDVFRELEIKELNVQILEAVLKRNKKESLRVTYGVDDDTAFDYDDYTNVTEYEGYLDILKQGITTYDTVCKIDKSTGNAYRVKVDKDNGGYPSLFEVGGFRDYIESGDEGFEDEEEISLNFTPVIINALDGNDAIDKAFSGDMAQQPLAVFVDAEMKALPNNKLELTNLLPGYYGASQLNPSFFETTIKLTCTWEESYDLENTDGNPLEAYDAGYQLGIMRGPGNESGVEYPQLNYDGEGNDSWVQTVGSYAFTSDSCDMYGRFFDYNGTEAGGADQSGRFSLKLVAEKDGFPIGDSYKNRGLVAKFLSEYLYFMAHKKTIVLTVKMGITQIINIDFLKRYKIGEYVGYINKVSYTLSSIGIEDVEIELYTL